MGLNATSGVPDGLLRDLKLSMPGELLVNFAAAAECSDVDFHTPRTSPNEVSASGERCPAASQVGVVTVEMAGSVRHFGLFNLAPSFGLPGAIGFAPFGEHVTFGGRLRGADGGIDLFLDDASQSLALHGMRLTMWGTPWLSEHDGERGNCLNEQTGGSFGDCPVFDSMPAPEPLIKSYLTLPSTPCGTPLSVNALVSSWDGDEAEATATMAALEGCEESLATASVALTTEAARASTGLEFVLEANDDGVLDPGGRARPPIKQATVALPEGLTINPSLAAGLDVCSRAAFARESLSSVPGSACPNSSKVGRVEVEGALGQSKPLTGSLYVATPGDNPFGSLIGLYMVARHPERGLLLKAIGKLEPHLHGGRLTARVESLPRFHYDRFTLTLRAGPRSALVSPSSCGIYPFGISLASWAALGGNLEQQGTFAIEHGEEGGSCPGAVRSFSPGVLVGSVNPAAGAYTPLYMRMTRTNPEQEIASYSADFPPGLLGKVAGVPDCPEAAIELARQRSGIAEMTSPSCPAASMIGRTEVGFGVGHLAWARGALYLAGPYRGAPLSVVVVNPALVGPFDLGVVVVRTAVRVDPRTAQLSIDSAASDPLPPVLGGIPVHVRDIRVHLDRPHFSLNPTSCDVMAFRSSLTGTGVDLFSSDDDSRSISSQRFQVLGCSSLAFKPRLFFRLGKATRRGQFPSLHVTYVPRPGDTNLRAVASTLPKAIFLEQRHIGTVCTRPEFRARACPPKSVYGYAEAISPLFDEPLRGPVYMRASDNRLPDIVASLQSRGVATEVVGRVDSARGRIRTTFESLPDAPISMFRMSLFGGKKGILVLSKGICGRVHRAAAWLVGHNNATTTERPRLKASCRDRTRRPHRG